MGKVLLLFAGFGALGNNLRLRPQDSTRLKLLLLHPVDHVLLLLLLLLPQVVGTDDVDLGSRGTSLDHVHDVVRVRDVKAGKRKVLI